MVSHQRTLVLSDPQVTFPTLNGPDLHEVGKNGSLLERNASKSALNFVCYLEQLNVLFGLMSSIIAAVWPIPAGPPWHILPLCMRFGCLLRIRLFKILLA